MTIILKKSKIIPDILTAGGDTVGVRMPEGEIARKIVEYANIPVATSSANISGKPSGTNIEQIKRDFMSKVDLVNKADSMSKVSFINEANLKDKTEVVSKTEVASKGEIDSINKINYFVDGGESKIGIPSTIVQVVNGEPKILREGSIKLDDILKAI